MEYLRWIILVLGLIILLIIYLLGRSRIKDPQSSTWFNTDAQLEDVLLQEAAPWGRESTTPMAAHTSTLETLSKQKIPGTEDAVLSNLSHELETLNQLLKKEPPNESERLAFAGDNAASDVDDDADNHLDNAAPANDGPLAKQDCAPPNTRRGTTCEDKPNAGSSDRPALQFEPQNGTDGEVQRPVAEKIITVHIAAPARLHLAGSQLLDIFEQRGYRFGAMDIFHAQHDGKTVFSIVNSVEPGWFDPSSMHGFATPGISLFLQLPNALANDRAFDILIDEARVLASELNASLLDANRNAWTLQMEQHLRDELRQYTFEQQKLAAIQQRSR